MSTWNNGVLCDIAEISMGQSPKGESCNQNGNGLPLLNGPTEFGIKYPTPVQFTTSPTRLAQVGDILFCVRGSTTGKMNWANQEYVIGRGIAALRHKDGDLYQHYLRGIIDYQLPYLLSSATGSTFPNVSRAQLESLELQIPPLPEQKAIASVLFSLDDKIDLLHRQNKTLEAMAETLFRQWFVEEADDSWEWKELGEYVSTVDNRGKTPPNTEIVSNFPLIEANALNGDSRLINYSKIKKYVTEDVYNNWYRNKLNKYNSLITTVGANIGALSMYIVERGNIAQNIIGLSAKNFSPFLLYELLKYKKDSIIQLDIGGVQPSIKVPHLLSMIIPIPSLSIQRKFDSIIEPIVNKMEYNHKQIQLLETKRSILLPKLMSGEVRVV